MRYTIRKAAKEDIPHIQRVAQESWGATYEGIIPKEIQKRFLSSAYSDESMERRVSHSLLLVAETNRSIVGFANFSPLQDGGKAELGAIYLLPEYQGTGIGTALLESGIGHLEGVKELFINVEKENKIGLTFYHAKGFQVVSEFDEDFDGHMLKTIRMKKQMKHAEVS